jgi:hypothetical protein
MDPTSPKAETLTKKTRCFPEMSPGCPDRERVSGAFTTRCASKMGPIWTGESKLRFGFKVIARMTFRYQCGYAALIVATALLLDVLRLDRMLTPNVLGTQYARPGHWS